MDFLTNIYKVIKDTTPPLHDAGIPFVIGAAVLCLIGFTISGEIGLVLLFVALWVAFFFRDPKRMVPQGDNLIISPADGLVQLIEEVDAPEELDVKEQKYTRISIFLNVFNVHVNRYPVGGKVSEVLYNEGKFLSANLEKASMENERNSIVIKTKDGHDIICVQIAGLVARRILSDAKEGSEVAAGARYGIIRFGSRMDVYLPHGIKPRVVVGQTAVGGETILASLDGKQTALKANLI